MSYSRDINHSRRYGYQAEKTVDIDSIYLDQISKTITKQLTGVHPEGRPIIVPDETIKNVLYDLSMYYKTPDEIIVNSIDKIVDYVSYDYAQEQRYRSLNIWDATILGNSNPNGLSAHSTLKLNDKNRDRMKFFAMNY